jgi:hypothetical protein
MKTLAALPLRPILLGALALLLGVSPAAAGPKMAGNITNDPHAAQATTSSVRMATSRNIADKAEANLQFAGAPRRAAGPRHTLASVSPTTPLSSKNQFEALSERGPAKEGGVYKAPIQP